MLRVFIPSFMLIVCNSLITDSSRFYLFIYLLKLIGLIQNSFCLVSVPFLHYKEVPGKSASQLPTVLLYVTGVLARTALDAPRMNCSLLHVAMIMWVRLFSNTSCFCRKNPGSVYLGYHSAGKENSSSTTSVGPKSRILSV